MTASLTPWARPQLQLNWARWCRWLGVAVMVALASGCASVMRVDNQVKSYDKWPSDAILTSETRYVFDKLLSHASTDINGDQSTLESWAAQALARANWVRAAPDAPARWQVQVSARTNTLPRAPWEEPPDGRGMRWGLSVGVGGRVGGQVGLGGLMAVDRPYYVRTVSVVIRDTQTAQVVFETTATHEGRWGDSPRLWQAMLDAALDGFPQPTQPVRRVDIDVPR